MTKVIGWLILLVGAVALAAGIAFLFGYMLMLGINYIFAPSLLLFVFGAPAITFWKAYVLSFVTGMLFTSRSIKSESE